MSLRHERQDVLDFTAPGRPIPKGRPQTGQGRTFTPQRTRDAEEYIAQVAAIAMLAAGHRQPFDEPLGLRATFVLPDRRGLADTSNLLKLIEDSVNEIVWTDDKWVEEIAARRLIQPLDPHGGYSRLEVWRFPNPGHPQGIKS